MRRPPKNSLPVKSAFDPSAISLSAGRVPRRFLLTIAADNYDRI